MTFNINFDSKDKTRSIVHNLGRALLKKKTLMLGSKETDTINKLYICGTFKNLYLGEEKLK